MLIPHKISCGLPVINGKQATDSICLDGDGEWRFQLKDGYEGQCEGDSQKRKERIELRGDTLEHGKTYEVSFIVQFDSCTESAKKTKFFQIHQYDSSAGGSIASKEPIFMLSIHTDQLVLTGQPLKEPPYQDFGDLHGFKPTSIGRKALVNQVHTVRVQFSLIPNCLNDLMVSINDQRIIDCKAWVDADGSPFLKCGLYRNAGENGSINPTDRIAIGELRAEEIA